ncbi:MAG TPA: hypothetical protein VLL48_10175 [Longimicrobiales bacterium]|nr:hypothetical protein [Longimicrobiales bacterium]
MDLRARALRWLLWFVSVSHLLLGLGAFLSAEFRLWVGRLYGADLVWTDELGYVAAMGAAFMVGLGVAGVAAARDPARHRAVVMAFAVVLLLRVAQRLAQPGAIEELFGIPVWRTVANAVFFAALAAALLLLLPPARPEANRDEGPS